MRTPPTGLDDRALAALLGGAWGWDVAALAYAPVGFGSHHWTATGVDGGRRFVTVDLGDAAGVERLRAALTTAAALRDVAGLSFVVAPLPARDGSVLQVLPTTEGSGLAAVTLYPYVDSLVPPPGGAPDAPLPSGADAAALVRLLARLHVATPHVRDVVDVDDLAVQDRPALERALRRLDEPWRSGSYGEPARRLLAEHADRVAALLAAYDDRAAELRDPVEDWVVTHGEPKADNVLVTPDGLRLVDWDTVRLAPAARDLWLLDRAAVARYSGSTGRTVPSGQLELFRLRWALSDVASFAREFSEPHQRTADTETSWHALEGTLRALP